MGYLPGCEIKALMEIKAVKQIKFHLRYFAGS